MVELSKEKNIIGVKEASGNINQISDVTRLCGDDFMVWSGDDAMTLPLLSVGGHGVISVSANIIPKDVRAMVHAYLQGNYKEALHLHRKMAELTSSLFIETNPVPVKTACNLLSQSPDYGLPHCGEFRLPMVDMLPQNLEALKASMKAYGLPVS
jgi:4-hydroxy-tetrahydrodipicolinate synthase